MTNDDGDGDDDEDEEDNDDEDGAARPREQAAAAAQQEIVPAPRRPGKRQLAPPPLDEGARPSSASIFRFLVDVRILFIFGCFS